MFLIFTLPLLIILSKIFREGTVEKRYATLRQRQQRLFVFYNDFFFSRYSFRQEQLRGKLIYNTSINIGTFRLLYKWIMK